MSRLLTAAATDTGYLRATNQDVALATNDLAAVADGMGDILAARLPPGSRSRSCSTRTAGTGRQKAWSRPRVSPTPPSIAGACQIATFGGWARP